MGKAVSPLGASLMALWWALPATSQVDPGRASAYFQEAEALCRREGGRLWGMPLWGPMVFADAATRTIATNQPAPEAERPAAVGLANTAVDWGGTRWTTIVWQLVPHDQPEARGRLMLHELFHRIQPDLGLRVAEGQYDHLDTFEGRYWIQLEWRALARALGANGPKRAAAIRDALSFRMARRARIPGAAENERRLEINEGLAQYTGTVAAFPSPGEAAADAIDQLARAEKEPTFVRTFAYPSGAAYGLLLDACSPGWTRRMKPSDDLGHLLREAERLEPAAEAEALAKDYGGPDLIAAERRREAEQKARIADLRRRFIEGPVLVLPPPRNASFVTAGMTPIPGEGTVTLSFRTTAEWGTLEAGLVLVAPDRSRLTVPAPAKSKGPSLFGEGWTLQIQPGWVVRPGPRAGDFRLVREE
ncbi:MAG: hypothetical protein U0529_03410 [Thermoanaerobaculia bacterium]